MLVKLSNEQIEEEGGFEEIEAQLNSKENHTIIKTRDAKNDLLNFFEYKNNKRYRVQLSNEQKEKKLNKIYKKLKKKDLNDFIEIFDENSFNFINQQITECKSGIENILLDIIELIIEKRFFKCGQNRFYGIFQDTGLLKKVYDLIKQKAEKKKKDNFDVQYSEFIEQLIRIYLFIMQYQYIYKQNTNICVKILDANLSIIMNKLKGICQQKDKENKIKIKNKEFEKELIRTSKTIRIFGQYRNCRYTIPHQIQLLIKERIIPLIHINCPKELNCPLQIYVPNLKGIPVLKNAALFALSEVSGSEHYFRDYIIENRNILNHLIPPIISYNISYQYNKKIKTKEQQLQSLLFASESIQLFYTLISENKTVLQSIINNPILLPSIIKLSNYNLNINVNKQVDDYANQIRQNSRNCLSKIQFYGDKSIQVLLSTSNYAGSLTITLNTAGGSGEEDVDQIYPALTNLQEFISDLQQGREYLYNFFSIPTFSPQPMLAKLSNEQIEEEGGLEEIEAQLNNKENYIMTKTNVAKNDLLNLFVHLSNQIRWY